MGAFHKLHTLLPLNRRPFRLSLERSNATSEGARVDKFCVYDDRDTPYRFRGYQLRRVLMPTQSSGVGSH